MVFNKKIHIRLFVLCFILTQVFFSSAAFAQSQQLDRLSGSDRYKTAAAISMNGWPDGSDYVILARGDDFADALCAGPLAKKYDAPILLTGTGNLETSTLDEIKRLNATHVIVVGGTGAVSQDAESSIRSAGITDVERIWGADRYETSVMIAQRLDESSKVVIATGSDFPDALSVSAIASKLGMPILLTEKQKLPDKVKAFIDGGQFMLTYLIGGAGVISGDIENVVPSPVRLGGQDRYETNVLVMQEFEEELDFTSIYVAVGDGPGSNGFADALTGAVLASRTSSPVVLTYKSLSKVTEDYLKSKSDPSNRVIALGGEGVVSNVLVDAIVTHITQPGAVQPVPPVGGGGGAAPSVPISKEAALLKTNDQLDDVLDEVTDASAKEWVERVILINSMMVEDPESDFSSDISSAKSQYNSLPVDVKNDIRRAALNNLDIESVRVLVNEYDI